MGVSVHSVNARPLALSRYAADNRCVEGVTDLGAIVREQMHRYMIHTCVTTTLQRLVNEIDG